jgi:hypothetical protein
LRNSTKSDGKGKVARVGAPQSKERQGKMKNKPSSAPPLNKEHRKKMNCATQRKLKF